MGSTGALRGRRGVPRWKWWRTSGKSGEVEILEESVVREGNDEEEGILEKETVVREEGDDEEAGILEEESVVREEGDDEEAGILEEESAVREEGDDE